jgi:hypothetical protein
VSIGDRRGEGWGRWGLEHLLAHHILGYLATGTAAEVRRQTARKQGYTPRQGKFPKAISSGFKIGQSNGFEPKGTRKIKLFRITK